MTQTAFPEPFESFVAPARGKPALWRVFVGFLIILAIYLLITVTVFGVLAVVTGMQDAADVRDVDPRLTMTLLLLTFGGVTLGVWAAVKLMHGRRFATLIGPVRPALRDFTVATLVLLLIQSVLLGIWAVPFDAIVQRTLAAVLVTLPLVLVLTLLQTSAEEFLFRGYLMQQLAARFRATWVWLVIPQALFAVAHFDPFTMGVLAWPIVGLIFLYALMWADLTRITGNIGAACGWHFANNFILFALISPPGELSAFAWMHVPYEMADTPPIAFVLDAIAAAAIWLILRRVLRR